MLQKIKGLFKKKIGRELFDPTRFNDPLAEQIGWSPVNGGGSNFQTHRLVKLDYNRIEFKPTLGIKLFSGLFVVVGIAIPLFILYQDLENGNPIDSNQILFTAVFSLGFVGAGSLFYYLKAKPVVFDKLSGLYWKGRKKPEHNFRTTGKQEGIPFRDIYAIQLLSEYIKGDKNSYYSYELNLVLSNGERLNVIDHGKKSKIVEDANILSEFLNKPVWNAI